MSKRSIKKVHRNLSWYLSAGKLKTEQKLIALPCLHSPPYLFSRKVCTPSHSTEFLNWGDHVNSVPDLTASPPSPAPRVFRSHGTTLTVRKFKCLASRWKLWTLKSGSKYGRKFERQGVYTVTDKIFPRRRRGCMDACLLSWKKTGK